MDSASQIWVISSGDAEGYGYVGLARDRALNEAHRRLLIAKWRAGAGLYIFGDNEPFFVDGNALLRDMGADLNPEDPTTVPLMSGNHVGGEIVACNEGGASNPRCSLLTTGLRKLFEGITVASVEPAAA